MSFFDVETENGFLELEDENGEKMGITLEIQPMSSDKVQRVVRHYESQIFNAMRRNKDVSSLIEERNTKMLAAAIVGWEWSPNARVTTPDGHEVPLRRKDYSEENALAMVKDRDFADVRDQIDNFLGRNSNFYSAQSSVSVTPSES